MAPKNHKKPATKTKRNAPKKKAAPFSISLLKAFTVAFVLIGLSVGVAILASHFINVPVISQRDPVTQVESVPAASETRKLAVKPEEPPSGVSPKKAKPQFEIYPQEIETVIEQKFPVIEVKMPLVAIIVDDLGYDQWIADAFLAIDATITVAILPGSPLQQSIAEKAHAKGFEIMLHQPMEPVEFPSINPGPKALLSSMNADDMIRQLQNNIAAMPYVKGVNNHMGSRLTSESDRMNQVFTVLKQQDLFFIDSRTTKETMARSSARLLKIRFAERDVFLDHKQDSEFIKKQFILLVQTAKRNGSAIGIAHPYQLTLDILQETLPDLVKQVQLVPASRIVRPADGTG